MPPRYSRAIMRGGITFTVGSDAEPSFDLPPEEVELIHHYLRHRRLGINAEETFREALLGGDEVSVWPIDSGPDATAVLSALEAIADEQQRQLSQAALDLRDHLSDSLGV